MASKVGCGGQRRSLALVGALVSMAVLAACGDDGTLEVSAPRSEARAYCEKVLEIETLQPDIDFESLSPEQLKVETRKFATGFIPLAEQTAALAPAEIKNDVNVLVESARRVGQTGDFAEFDRPPADKAGDRVHAFDLENCGWGQAKVTAGEYAFSGLPKEAEAGPVSFDLTNNGKEPHHLVVLRINDGVTDSVKDIVNLPEEEAMKKVKSVGGGDPVAPGKSGYSVVKLTKGRYAMACFLPVGGGEDGPPHVTRGMYAELNVA